MAEPKTFIENSYLWVNTFLPIGLTIISSVTLYYLRKTLLATKEYVEETKKAAQIAKQSIETDKFHYKKSITLNRINLINKNIIELIDKTREIKYERLPKYSGEHDTVLLLGINALKAYSSDLTYVVQSGNYIFVQENILLDYTFYISQINIYLDEIIDINFYEPEIINQLLPVINLIHNFYFNSLEPASDKIFKFDFHEYIESVEPNSPIHELFDTFIKNLETLTNFHKNMISIQEILKSYLKKETDNLDSVIKNLAKENLELENEKLELENKLQTFSSNPTQTP